MDPTRTREIGVKVMDVLLGLIETLCSNPFGFCHIFLLLEKYKRDQRRTNGETKHPTADRLQR